MASGQIRITLLNPGVEISPLRLRGWLQTEAARVNARCGPDDGVILRLFLTKKLRYAFTGDKLDAMLRTLTEKYPAILRVETQLVDAPLDQAQMEIQTREANTRLEAFVKLAQAHAAKREAEAREAEVQKQLSPIQWHTLTPSQK